MTGEPVAGQPLRIFYRIKNTGKIPALKIALKTALTFSDMDRPIDWSKAEPMNGNGILFPGEIGAEDEMMRPSAPFIPDQNAIKLYMADSWVLYGHIRIEYSDMFGDR